MATALENEPQVQPTNKPHLPGIPDVAKQAFHDVIGKDVQETPTVSYVWMADQLGHFGMGFMITYLLGWIATLLGHGAKETLAGLAVFNFLIWVVKETFDYFLEAANAKKASNRFPFNRKEILFNIFTALFYIGIGTLVAFCAIFDPLWAVCALGIVLLPAQALAYWWLRRKITFQQADLPYLYRLANFPNDVGENKDYILGLAKPDNRICRHLIISGPLASGKSSLAVGIGTEFAFNMGIARYTSLVKLIQSIEKRRQRVQNVEVDKLSIQGEFQDGRILWPWESAELLIIDDVDDVTRLCKPVEDTARRFSDTPAAQPPVHQVEAVLKERLRSILGGLNLRRTVWVISDGGVLGDGIDPDRFKEMLIRLLSLQPDHVAIVKLNLTISEAIQQPASN
jgi:hypothetical protein